jgi:type III secretion protein U
MAGGNEGGEERNLPPTERRLQRLRQQGQVPRSKDFETALALLAALVYFVFAWRGIAERMQVTFLVFDPAMPQGFLAEVSRALNAQLRLLQEILIPLFVVVFGAHILAIILDAKGLPLNFKAITPNFSKLNPVQGVKQLFSLRNLFDLLKGIALITAIFGVNYFLFTHYLNDLVWAPGCGDSCVMNVMIWLYGSSIAISIILLIIIALIDLPLSRIIFKRQNKMTVSELKREQKEDSGAPEIRAARKQMAEQIAQTSGYIGLSKVDIVIAFGDRAIGLVFRQGDTAAPIIAARTFDRAADFIKEAALRKLPIVEEPELLVKLLDGGALGNFIPMATFNDVARILIQTGVVKV